MGRPRTPQTSFLTQYGAQRALGANVYVLARCPATLDRLLEGARVGLQIVHKSSRTGASQVMGMWAEQWLNLGRDLPNSVEVVVQLGLRTFEEDSDFEDD